MSVARSGRCSLAEGSSGVVDAPFVLGRGVVEPSMAWSSVEAELFTGRKEAMMGRRKMWEAGDVNVSLGVGGGVERQNQPYPPAVAKPATRSASL